jgi:DNA polymerase-3 subunit epsilon
LKPTAESLGISFRHHDALEDARACAEIVLAAARFQDAGDWNDLEAALSIQRGRVAFGSRVGPRSIRRQRRDSSSIGSMQTTPVPMSSSLQIKTILDGCRGLKPLDRKRIFLSGSILGLERASAVEFLQALGAIVDSELSAKTSFWVMAPSDSASEAGLEQATNHLASGEDGSSKIGPTRVISQRQLLAMIPGGLEVARATHPSGGRQAVQRRSGSKWQKRFE